MGTSHIHVRFGQRVTRVGLGMLVVALLVTLAAWHGLAAAARAEAPLVTPAPMLPQSPPTRGGRDSYADIVRLVAPAVVTIRTEGKAQTAAASLPGDEFFRRFFGDQLGEAPHQPRTFRQQGLGSGVIVSSDGYILTNHHVVEGADEIRVDLVDGRSVKARLIGSDPPSDLALLKIEVGDLHAISLGDSDAVQVGDVVLAVGNPLGVGQTVTMGIVSAKGRSTGVGDGSYEDFLQTDAPINQGNSGGALVNTKGELVGINSQILSPSQGNIGIGFAIPAKMAGHVMTLLRTEGRVRRSQLGVTVQPVTSDLAASLGLTQVAGAIVSSVAPGSAAEHAGVKQGDVITSLNGEPIRDTNALRNRVADTPPGSRVTLTVIRDGRERDLSAQLEEVPSRAERRAENQDGTRNDTFGASVAPVSPELASQAGLPPDARGLLVERVDPDSRAADAGLRPGDLIEEVNRRPMRSVDELRAAVRSSSERPVLLLVNRGGRELFLTAAAS